MKYVIKQGKHIIHTNPDNLSKEELKCARDAFCDPGCIYADLRAEKGDTIASAKRRADIQREITAQQKLGHLPYISREQ